MSYTQQALLSEQELQDKTLQEEGEYFAGDPMIAYELKKMLRDDDLDYNPDQKVIDNERDNSRIDAYMTSPTW